MAQIDNSLLQKLATTRNWWRLTRVIGGVAWTISLLILFGLLCFHVDRTTTLSAAARENWRLIILLSVGIVLAASVLFAMLRKLPDRELAAQVEQRYPVLRERLLTSVDLVPALAMSGSDSGSMSSGFSRSMSSALVEETQKEAAGLNFRRAIRTRSVRVALMASLFMGVLLVVHMMMAPDAFANWVRRMVNPRADIAPWANTRVWITPQTDILPRGAGVNVVVTTRGTATQRCVLSYRTSGDANIPWQTAELTNPTSITTASSTHLSSAAVPGENQAADSTPPRQFLYHFASLPQSVTMFASANDGKSNEKSILVEDRPTLTGIRMMLHYPAYTHKAAQVMTLSNGSVAAPIGTEIDVEALANKPLRSAEYIQNNSPAGAWPIRLNNSTHKKDEAVGHIGVWKDGSYSLNLVDTRGFESQNSPRYEVRALKDQTPTVQISRPATDIELQPEGSLPLVAHAVDDYGIDHVQLNYQLDREKAAGIESRTRKGALALPGADGKPAVTIEERWFIASVRPQVGETLTYYVSATDNGTIPGPNTGRSMPYRVHVLSLAEMQRRMADQLNAEQASLAALRKQQIDAQNQLRQAEQKRNPAAMAKAQESERALAQEAKSVAQRVANTSAQLENNRLATPSELARRNEAEQTLNQVGDKKAPEAANKIQKAQPTQPNQKGDPSNSQNLASADKQESEIKHDIESAMEKTSRTPPASELAKEAMRLAKEQQDRGDASRTLAEDMNAQKKETGKPMSAEDKSALEQERKHQADLNADTQRLQNQLEAAAKAAKERGQNQEAKALQQAAAALQQGKTTQKQQQAQNSLNKNNPAEAAPNQDRAAAALAKAAEAAKQAEKDNQNESAADAAERLDKAAKDLNKLAEEQKNLADQAAQSPDGQQSKSMADQQQALQNATQQAQKNLSGSPQAQQSAKNAQQNQSKSGQQLSKNQPQSAKAPAKTAAQQLAQAAQQAQNAANQIRQQQAAQELADKVDRLAQVQRGLLNATERLQTAQSKGQLDSGQERELGQTAQRQENIEQQAKTLAETVPSPAFQQALKMAAKQMHPASQNLNQDHPNTGQQTQSAQNRALQTLQTITQALKQQGQKDGQQQQQDGQQGQQGQSPEQMQQQAATGDLALAQGLQQALRQSTGALDKARKANPNQQLNPGQQQESDQLAQGQQDVESITQSAGQALSGVPGIEQAIQQATQHMAQAGKNLSQQQTGQPTQGHQDSAVQSLEQAIKAAQQAMQQQQQQQQAQGQGKGIPQPVPSNQPGNKPDQNAFQKLVDAHKGAMQTPGARNGKGFSTLNPREQRVMREGQKEPVPAEYQNLVERYRKSLSNDKR